MCVFFYYFKFVSDSVGSRPFFALFLFCLFFTLSLANARSIGLNPLLFFRNSLNTFRSEFVCELCVALAKDFSRIIGPNRMNIRNSD